MIAATMPGLGHPFQLPVDDFLRFARLCGVAARAASGEMTAKEAMALEAGVY